MLPDRHPQDAETRFKAVAQTGAAAMSLSFSAQDLP